MNVHVHLRISYVKTKIIFMKKMISIEINEFREQTIVFKSNKFQLKLLSAFSGRFVDNWSKPRWRVKVQALGANAPIFFTEWRVDIQTTILGMT